MNLAIRGIDANITWADFVLANLPFNAEDWSLSKIKDDVRWAYGAPPAGGGRNMGALVLTPGRYSAICPTPRSKRMVRG